MLCSVGGWVLWVLCVWCVLCVFCVFFVWCVLCVLGVWCVLCVLGVLGVWCVLCVLVVWCVLCVLGVLGVLCVWVCSPCSLCPLCWGPVCLCVFPPALPVWVFPPALPALPASPSLPFPSGRLVVGRVCVPPLAFPGPVSAPSGGVVWGSRPWGAVRGPGGREGPH